MTPFPRTCVVAAAAWLVAGLAPAQPRNAGKTHVRHIFVLVTDSRGKPVDGLSASDFRVTEAGMPRAVSHAGPANDPMRIALMLDTSDAASQSLTHLRNGAIALIDALPPEDEVLIVTIGRQVLVRVPPTTDRKKLKDTAGGLFTEGLGTVLMDGLLEIDDRFFKKFDDRWPVFVIFTSDGTENSARGHDNEFTKWAAAMGPRGITAHAFVLKTKGGGLPEIVAENLTQNSGGRYDVMNTTTALPGKMKALGEQLALDQISMSWWYEVDIQTDATQIRPVEVAVPREDVRVQVSDRRLSQ